MPLALYNSLTRTKEPFEPSTPGHAGMYVCGPTVYSDAHLGHGKTAVAFDIIRRWLMHSGYKVRYVSNITDVGHITTDASDVGHDRINERARLESVEPMQIADQYFWRYAQDMDTLNVLRPDITPRATGHILEQIELVEALIRSGHAYESGGSVYFRVQNYPRYGVLSGRTPSDLLTGTREDVREEKEHPLDFAVWKFAEPSHVMRWNSPWGEGFPGWHIECSAMALKYLGPGFDIHGGGLDIMFPHHEAEIAQAEAAGHAFARYWLHSNMLTINGEKMSKSKGNFVTLRDFYAAHDPMTLRYVFATTHYRSVAEVSADTVTAAEANLHRLRTALADLKARADLPPGPGPHSPLDEDTQAFTQAFASAMNDDFNTPQAIAAVNVFLRRALHPARPAHPEAYARAAEHVEAALGDVLGLNLLPASGVTRTAPVPDEGRPLIDKLVHLRHELRLGKDYRTSDALRRILEEENIQVEDTGDGPRWSLKAGPRGA